MAKHTIKDEYKVEGYDKRKLTYTIGLVIFAVVLATMITLGFITLASVTSFIELVIILVGILSGIYGLVTNAMARKNVEPPVTDITTEYLL